MRIALVVNPGSGGGTDPEAVAVALRAQGAEVRAFALGDPDALVAAAECRPDRLAVASGDGAIGPVADLAGRLAIPLAVLPTGTANDFARANDLPRGLAAAAALAATGTVTRALDLGRLADGRAFVNVASGGLASLASRRAAALKPALGPLAYAAGALRAALAGRPIDIQVAVDGTERWAGSAWQVIVAITGAFGGGSRIGRAQPDDGALDVVTVPAGSRLGLARRAWGLRRHTLAEQEGVPHHRGRRVEVLLPPGRVCTVDGELRRTGLESVTAEPRAFALVVPSGREG